MRRPTTRAANLDAGSSQGANRPPRSLSASLRRAVHAATLGLGPFTLRSKEHKEAGGGDS